MGFKNLLDEWLQRVPDIPRVLGFEPSARNYKGNPSNSIRDWVKLTDYSDFCINLDDLFEEGDIDPKEEM